MVIVFVDGESCEVSSVSMSMWVCGYVKVVIDERGWLSDGWVVGWVLS